MIVALHAKGKGPWVLFKEKFCAAKQSLCFVSASAHSHAWFGTHRGRILTKSAWRHVQISMVDGDMLDSLEEVARSVRRCKQPFGGLQLVLTGDFHQLPPVAKGRQAMAGALDSTRFAEPALLKEAEVHPATGVYQSNLIHAVFFLRVLLS